MGNTEKLISISKLIRYLCLVSTTSAGSGHPTSSLSAADLMSVLFFGDIFRFDLDDPDHPNNDRLVFSKGHASPLFYSIWAAAGAVTEEEMMSLRKFGSSLEGHPTRAFKYTEVATGSLGQGLSAGLGMALNAKYIDKLPYRTYVLLGDSEMAEGSQWEAIQLAVHYKLDNLVGIIDVNRLGQRGETMYGHDTASYEKRISAFGWETFVIDGHSIDEILSAYQGAMKVRDRPVMIIAKTLKGKGVPLFEDKDGWHGKPLSKDELGKAIEDLGEIDRSVRGEIPKPEMAEKTMQLPQEIKGPSYSSDEHVATRKAYGNALKRIYPAFPDIVVLDAEVSNSTYAEIFKNEYPERFFEMYIAEQNMVGTATGFSTRGKIPFVSTFAAFLSRAYDQIRMCQYSNINIKFCGSHAGVSIGEDGSSQMGLEDIAMFRAILDSVVLYPSDAISTERLVEEMARHKGISYIRTTRGATPIIYSTDEEFVIGGSKVLRESNNDAITVIAAGITLHEALKAYEELKKEDIFIRVIDLYCIKPIDQVTLDKAAKDTGVLITVEDHFSEGGLGEAVRSAVPRVAPVYSLAVRKMPRSGKPAELLDYEEISAAAITLKVRSLL
ncbi:MAG TPA: transketolase [Nitrospirae bacterium]|nr:transketolase 2 [bacterium BMS3Bbin09]HDH34858.1 transketolase [Nitrospirota bacterium]HDN95393.1 transketolase [Nitrospirota bacterium]HDZ84845.1 transketolase [Nitrospirota bacterium]